MKKLSWIFLLSMILAGCNTIAGIGKDVERAGEVVQDAAKKK